MAGQRKSKTAKKPPKTKTDINKELNTDLTPRQERFIQEYLIDFNGTEAAIRAGYSKNGAAVQASRLLTHAKIKDLLQLSKQAIATRFDITRNGIINELAKIGYLNLPESEYKGSDKRAALVDIAKMTDNYGEKGININIQPVQNMWVIKGVKPVIEGETD